MSNENTIPLDDCKQVQVTGECLLEVLESDYKSGIGKESGKPWAKIELKLKVIEPKQFDGRHLTASIWVNQIEELLNAMGLQLQSVVKDGGVNKDLLKSTVAHKFFNARIGQDDRGYSRIAKILAKTNQSKMDI